MLPDCAPAAELLAAIWAAVWPESQYLHRYSHTIAHAEAFLGLLVFAHTSMRPESTHANWTCAPARAQLENQYGNGCYEDTQKASE
jgi:hypothetical protein